MGENHQTRNLLNIYFAQDKFKFILYGTNKKKLQISHIQFAVMCKIAFCTLKTKKIHKTISYAMLYALQVLWETNICLCYTVHENIADDLTVLMMMVNFLMNYLR